MERTKALIQGIRPGEPHYPSVVQRAGHRCEYCGAPEAVFNFPFEVEHPIPTLRDGSDEESNRVLACRSCNVFKGDQLTGLDETAASEERLFNLRQEPWVEHFWAMPKRAKSAV